MKAFMKRIIWFFGYGLLDLLGNWVFYITHGIAWTEHYPNDIVAMVSLIYLGIWYIPLIFMKDDKDLQKRAKK